MTRETQPERTRLSWLRTWLSLSGVGVAEARLVAAHRSGAVGATLILAVLLGAVAWVALRRRDVVLGTSRLVGAGREPLLVAACAVGVGLLGVLAVLVS